MLIECKNCGAPLDTKAQQGVLKCPYCKRDNRVESSKHVAEQTPQDWKPPQTWQSPDGAGQQYEYHAPKFNKLPLIIGLSTGLMVLGMSGFVAMMASSTAPEPATPKTRSMIDSVKGMTDLAKGLTDKARSAAKKARGRSMWDSVGGRPVIAEVDGHEAVIGRMRLKGDQLHVVATRSDKVKELYAIGPLGTYSEGYRSTMFAVVDDVLAVSDFRGKLHLHHLHGGKLIQTLELTDLAERLCPADKDGSVYVEQVDNKKLHVMVADGTTEPGKRPAGCERRNQLPRQPSARGGPTLSGARADRVFIDGTMGVVAAHKHPGTPHQRVAGFDPKTKKLRWDEALASVDRNLVNNREGAGALGGGRYAAVYKVGSETWRATAFDAEEGVRLWDVELRGIFAVDSIDDMRVTEDFVYIERTSSLDILAAGNGKLLGAVGNETYD